ncbi:MULTISPECIES: dienelactone hydrolase family protein [unclassified Thioalkalivibrio]|uniref:dienelactone hydrolase family protein n=1 Tax=unclassified Thioalkalivibrio TaxID=2621013 RepID=UPI000371BF08|nr:MULTISPECIES: alpha/beta family hydrolase [unclassified Thioalkalivibrio]
MSRAEERNVTLVLDGQPHQGILGLPGSPVGLVIFAHGSGSSRLSRRNRQVASTLQDSGMATLMFDLLTEEEDRTYANRFDIDLLGRRLVQACQWAAAQPSLAPLPLGLFGASTGAAAALRAAAAAPRTIQAVVSRGGRPDLAGDALDQVQSPTLLIVGGDDTTVIQLNRQAQARMRAGCELEIVPGASHLFEEPGTLEQAAGLAAAWFRRWLSPATTA